jgi:hypothetical protein
LRASPILDGTPKDGDCIAVERRRLGPLHTSDRSFAARCAGEATNFRELIVSREQMQRGYDALLVQDLLNRHGAFLFRLDAPPADNEHLPVLARMLD